VVYTLILLIGGFTFLIGGAELLVRGASNLALRMGISSLIVGLTVVALGTSAPELAVAIRSGLEGDPGLLVGNVVGSNIFNTLFIIGISAIIMPLIVAQRLIRFDIPFMIGITLLVYGFSWDRYIIRWEAALLLIILVAYITYLFYESRKESDPTVQKEYDEAYSVVTSLSFHWSIDLLMILAGLGLLVIGARWLVDSATEIALFWGVSSTIIGLTIVSVGTSLPEVATSIIAAIKGERDIAVGNVLGSNIFNLLGILGISGLILPRAIEIQTGLLTFDLPVMTAVAMACLPIFFTGYSISRWEGVVFLGYYGAYTSYLVLNAKQHDLLPLFNNVMLWFVLPITFITIIIITYREINQKSKETTV
jgi:cation:H+ antiporter